MHTSRCPLPLPLLPYSPSPQLVQSTRHVLAGSGAQHLALELRPLQDLEGIQVVILHAVAQLDAAVRTLAQPAQHNVVVEQRH